MTATLLLVNYHSSHLVAAAIESARAATERPLEIVVVDNSVSHDEETRLRQLRIDNVIVSRTNLGYGAGVNAALGDCTGDRIIVANPDVTFAEESLDLLLQPLEDARVALTGPAFFWDTQMRWHLPPPETMTFREQLSRNLSPRFESIRTARQKRLLERRIDVWRARSPRPASVLSGAVMAFRAKDLRRYQFDERYPLYFEEVDLMRRLGRAGHLIVYVPEAHVHHAWAQSSALNSDSQMLFDVSKRRYQQKWFGRIGELLLQQTSVPASPGCDGSELEQPYVEVPEGEFLVEVGDGREFTMAAGRFSSGGRVELPLEAMRRSPLDLFCCRIVDLGTRATVASWTVRLVWREEEEAPSPRQ